MTEPHSTPPSSNSRKSTGNGNLVQDLLLGSFVVVKKCRLDPNHCPQPKPHPPRYSKSDGDILQCSICTGGQQVRSFSTRETQILSDLLTQKVMVVTSTLLGAEESWPKVLTNICILCSRTMDKLINLRKEIADISICFRTALRMRLDKVNTELGIRRVDNGDEQRTESELVVVKVETEELGDNYRETGGKSIGLKLIPLQYLVDDKSEIMTVDGDYFMEQLSPKIEAEGTQIGEAVNEFDKPSSPTPTVAVPSIENQKNFNCETCEKSFPTGRHLRKHSRVHSRPFICHLCGRQFSGSTGLQYHLTTHIDKPKRIYKKANRFVAPQDKPISCKVCGKRFADKSGMYRHLKVIHKGFRYKCDACSNDFASLQMVKNHKLKAHGKGISGADKGHTAKPHKYGHTESPCDICSRTLVGKNNLGRHMELTHFPVKNCCPYGCSDKIENEQEWKLHLEQCTSEKLTDASKSYCFFCGEVFKTQLLKIAHHLAFHTSFPCEFCSRSFTRKDILAHHIYEHEEAKPFLCGKCGKKFRQLYNLTLHSTTVCGDDDEAKKKLIAKRRELHRVFRNKAKPHKCNLCPKAFVEERRLVDHKRKIHLNKIKDNISETSDMEETENEKLSLHAVKERELEVEKEKD